jgi:hypothetical protein
MQLRHIIQFHGKHIDSFANCAGTTQVFRLFGKTWYVSEHTVSSEHSIRPWTHNTVYHEILPIHITDTFEFDEDANKFIRPSYLAREVKILEDWLDVHPFPRYFKPTVKNLENLLHTN